MNESLLRFDRNQKYLVFDTETEGLNLINSRPWQVAWIVTQGDKVLEEHDVYVGWDDLEVSKDAARVTGFSKQDYERRAIDSIMTRLRSLVEETGVGLILVSHLRRIDGNRGHENGVETSVSHIRGSQSIAQISDAILSLERNQQSDDPIEASTTRVRILKSRYTGDVGIATYLLYDNETGRLSELAGDELSNSAEEDIDINLGFE